jgi:hypothetical protein
MGGGGANLRTYVCAADGKIVFFLEGYWDPESYLAELRAARQLFDQTKNSAGTLFTEAINAEIDKRIAESTKQRDALSRDFPAEFNRPISESKVRRDHAALNLKIKSYHSGKTLVSTDVAQILAASIRRNVERGAIT